MGKSIAFAIAAGVAAPLAALGQNFASQVGMVNRSVERVTLLTGPDLLSPADRPLRSAGTSSRPAALRSDAGPSFRFLPAPERLEFGEPASLRLITRQSATPPPAAAPASEAANAPSPAPTAESLRFDSTVPRTPVALPVETRTKVKPD